MAPKKGLTYEEFEGLLENRMSALDRSFTEEEQKKVGKAEKLISADPAHLNNKQIRSRAIFINLKNCVDYDAFRLGAIVTTPTVLSVSLLGDYIPRLLPWWARVRNTATGKSTASSSENHDSDGLPPPNDQVQLGMAASGEPQQLGMSQIES